MVVVPHSSVASPDTSSSTNTVRSVVVRVRLVELEHRELGVVAGGEALVAEHPADLEHLLEAAHHEPLEVELGRDAQERSHVERVVVRDEGRGRRAHRDGVQDGRLDLDEPGVPRGGAAASSRSGSATSATRGAALVGPQVDLTLAKARLDVGHALPLVAEAPTRASARSTQVRHLHRQLPLARPHHPPGRPHPVPERQAGRSASKSSVTFSSANSWTCPDESRSVAKARRPCGRVNMTRPATETTSSVSSPGPSDR